MSPRRAPVAPPKPAKRAPAKTTVPPLETSVRRPAPSRPLKRVIPATAPTKKGGSVSTPVKEASPFAHMKVYGVQDYLPIPKVVDPKVWELATFIREKGEPGVVDVEDWSSDDEKKFKQELDKCKSHADFVGARFYCKRGLLKNGHEALQVSLSYPGSETA